MLFKYDIPKEKMTNEVFDYVQSSYLTDLVYYIINSKYRTSVKLVDWMTGFDLNDLDPVLNEIPNGVDYDEQVIHCLKWVKNNINYLGDTTQWKMNEYWQTPIETEEIRLGDCEDGAILLYWLCRKKGVPANRLMIFAGTVDGGGHAWIGYRPIQYPLNWVFLDWCYWYNNDVIGTRRFFYIQDTEIWEYKPDGVEVDSNYFNIWFGFNEHKAYRRLNYER